MKKLIIAGVSLAALAAPVTQARAGTLGDLLAWILSTSPGPTGAPAHGASPDSIDDGTGITDE